MGAQEGPQKLVLEVYFGLGRVLGAKMGQDGPKTPPESSQDWFFLILEPNLVDFGAQLDGFWDSTWWILGPNLHDSAAPTGYRALWRAVGAALDIKKKYIYKYI